MKNYKLFAYGTLINPAVMEAVTGRSFEYEAANLPGYARYCIRDQVFPGIIAAQGEAVDGIIYHVIDDTGLQRLDTFESHVYLRKEVLVTLENKQQVNAYTYVMSPDYEFLLTGQPWDIEVFTRKHLDSYLKRI